MEDLGNSVSFTDDEMREAMHQAEEYINLLIVRVRKLPTGAGLARMVIFQTMALGGLSLMEALKENKYLALVKGIKVGVEVVERLGDSIFDTDAEVQFVGVDKGVLDRIKEVKALLGAGKISVDEAVDRMKNLAPEFSDITPDQMSGPFAAVEQDGARAPISEPSGPRAEGWGGGHTPKPTLH